VLASHHPVTLCGLSQVFEREPDCVVLSVCSDPDEIVATVQRHRPDVLILDLDGQDGFRVLRRLRRAHVATRVVVLAAASDSDQIAAAVRLGARAVVLKELPPEAFVERIRKVFDTDEPLDGGPLGDDGPLAVRRFENRVSKLLKGRSATRHATRPLTPREAEIARLAVLGVPTKDIATHLDVKQGTVKIHLHSIYEKLNVGGRLGLILFARRHGLT
jgi:DNA-binding NarL/FixJ family response regulator